MFEIRAGTTERISEADSGGAADAGSHRSSISHDGRYVAFESYASDLISEGDTNGAQDIYVYDRAKGEMSLASISSTGERANGDSFFPALSGDGHIVAFSSDASNLVADDTNNVKDIFARELGVGPPPVPVGQTFGYPGRSEHGANPTATSSDPVNTATGSFITDATDFELPGIGLPFSFTRTYNSADDTAGPLGVGWTHSYAASLTMESGGYVRFRAGDGQQLRFEERLDGGFDAPAGGRSSLRKLSDGYELVQRDQVRYRFDDDGRLATIEDRNGNRLSLGYDADGHLASMTDTVGRVISFTHDSASGLLQSVQLPDGRTVTYEFDGNHLVGVSGATQGGSTSYQYDAAGFLSQITDANGNAQVQNTYGTNGRVTEQLDALGNKTVLDWDAATQTSIVTDARGNRWTDVYDDNVLLRRKDPLGHTTGYEYGADLNLNTTTDPRGNTISMTYDDHGNLLTRTAPAPLSYEERFAYTDENGLAAYTDGRGNTTTYEYDSGGNLIKLTRPGDVVTEFDRDPDTGLLTSLTDPRGKTTTFAYDSHGNLIEQASPLGNTVTMTYDGAGRLESRVDPRGNVDDADPEQFRWTFTYDDADRLTSQTDPLGHTTSWGYDSVGNLIEILDPKGRQTTYRHNATNELVAVVAPDGSETQYAYDAVGNLCQRTDTEGQVTGYGYDAANQPAEIITAAANSDPSSCAFSATDSSQVWTYTYDAAGNRIEDVTPIGNATEDPDDGTITYAHDELDRLTGISYSDETPSVAFAYDANGNRVAMTDGAGAKTYRYDSLDRLVEVERGSVSFRYTYDDASNLTKRTYPDGTEVMLSYDDDGRLALVATGTDVTSYSYDPAGHRVEKLLPNGYRDTRSYDAAGRLTEVRHWALLDGEPFVLSRRTYALDATGNPVEVRDETGGTTLHAYGAQDRLTETCFDGSTCSDFLRYTYDGVGNRLSEDRPTQTTSYTYNALHQLTEADIADAGSTTYEYDPNGNQVRAGAMESTYDLANRLTSVTTGTETHTYAYDGDGKRLGASSADSSEGVEYLWDPNMPLPVVALERDADGEATRRHISDDQQPLSFSEGDGLLESFYHHLDAVGSVVEVTDTVGVPQWSYEYEPFGTLRTTERLSDLAPENERLFTGEFLDEPSGLYHLRARDYDPQQGRFVQKDPLALPITDSYVAAYVYADDRPTVLTDPSGECIFGTNPDGSCRGSSLLPAAKTGLKIVAVGGGVVAVVASGGTVAAAAGGASFLASAGVAAIDCNQAGIRSRECASSSAGAALGGATLGAGRLFKELGRGTATVGTAGSALGLLPWTGENKRVK